MPVSPKPERPIAYPQVVANASAATDMPLPAAFHKAAVANLVGLYSSDGIWPKMPDNPRAVAEFEAGQRFLVEEKDVESAICSFEACISDEPTFLEAYISLGVAYAMSNTDDGLAAAEDVFIGLISMESSGWISKAVVSMIHQNLGSVYLMRASDCTTTDCDRDGWLQHSDSQFELSDSAGGPSNGVPDRLELLCPWAYVKQQLNQPPEAAALIRRIVSFVDANDAWDALTDFIAKYPSLAALGQ